MAKSILIKSKGKMQVFVSGIGHRESKRLYEKCASGPDFMNDFHVLGETIQRSV